MSSRFALTRSSGRRATAQPQHLSPGVDHYGDAERRSGFWGFFRHGVSGVQQRRRGLGPDRIRPGASGCRDSLLVWRSRSLRRRGVGGHEDIEQRKMGLMETALCRYQRDVLELYFTKFGGLHIKVLVRVLAFGGW